jgi:hypothetical protein
MASVRRTVGSISRIVHRPMPRCYLCSTFPAFSTGNLGYVRRTSLPAQSTRRGVVLYPIHCGLIMKQLCVESDTFPKVSCPLVEIPRSRQKVLSPEAHLRGTRKSRLAVTHQPSNLVSYRLTAPNCSLR